MLPATSRNRFMLAYLVYAGHGHSAEVRGKRSQGYQALSPLEELKCLQLDHNFRLRDSRTVLVSLFLSMIPTSGWHCQVPPIAIHNSGKGSLRRGTARELDFIKIQMSGAGQATDRDRSVSRSSRKKQARSVRVENPRVSKFGVLNLTGIDQVPAADLLRYLPASELPRAEDHKVIERQLGYTATGMFAVEGARCKYGKPRAIIQYPCSHKIASGMIRLTCPHLVKEIDNWESEGAIEHINRLLRFQGNLKSSFRETNRQHAALRNAAITSDEHQLIRDFLGPDAGRHMLECGIIGVRQENLDDIKCVHAQVADHLLRGENAIGETCLEHLTKERGVDVSGCNGCSQQCDLGVPKEDATWWYVPAKNKQKLFAKRLRRTQSKARLRSEKEELDVAPMKI